VNSEITASTRDADIAIVGGGAAGLATAIFAAREIRAKGGAPKHIVLLDGARTLGAKILVSGGTRCNVTNARVEAADFWNAASPFVRQVLRALPVAETIAFFEEIGVALKEEPLGKMFPVTNRSRTVVDALLGEARRLGVVIETGCRVLELRREADRWVLETSLGTKRVARVVLATGGLSLPKTGSDGVGYRLAKAQGHSIVQTVPALEPLVLAGGFHAALSGIAHETTIRVSRAGEKAVTVGGSLLWTHFGISGPAALDASRFYRRAKADDVPVTITLSFVPDLTSEAVDRQIQDAARESPHTKLAAELSRRFGLPQAVGLALADHTLPGQERGRDRLVGRITREERRALVTALTAMPLDVADGRGYNFAEVTSGGVATDEVSPKTMESRVAPGLYFAGEILDVDGRLGGFNFQWAWASARVAGRALAVPTKG
jgi:predicted Rossmann fold flavoprotein